MKQEKTKQEIWKKLDGFHRYQISSLGRVKRCQENIIRNGIYGGIYRVKEKILTPNIDNVGRIHYRLMNDQNEIKLFKINRLVYMAFNGEIPEGYEVDHIDGDRFNNSIDNLQILTPEENSAKRAYEPKFIAVCNQTGEIVLRFKTWAKKKKIEYDNYYFWKAIFTGEKYMNTNFSFHREMI